jgi:hypothetical protein
MFVFERRLLDAFPYQFERGCDQYGGVIDHQTHKKYSRRRTSSAQHSFPLAFGEREQMIKQISAL